MEVDIIAAGALAYELARAEAADHQRPADDRGGPAMTNPLPDASA